MKLLAMKGKLDLRFQGVRGFGAPYLITSTVGKSIILLIS